MFMAVYLSTVIGYVERRVVVLSFQIWILNRFAKSGAVDDSTDACQEQ